MNQVLSRSWWVIFPAFAALTARLGFERACADPDHLLPGAMSAPPAAWPIALLYVAAHAWLAAAFLEAAAVSASPWPSFTQLRAAWTTLTWKVVLMAAALTVEYLPVTFWRGAGGPFC